MMRIRNHSIAIHVYSWRNLYHLLKRLSHLLLVSGLSLCAYTASADTDSLHAVLKSNVHDSTRVKTLRALSNVYYRADPDKSLEYLQQAEKVLTTSFRDTEMLIAVLIGKSGAYRSMGNRQKQLDQMLKAEELVRPGMKQFFQVNANLAISYEEIGKYDKAEEVIRKLLREAEVSEDDKTLVDLYTMTASHFKTRMVLDSAIAYNIKAMETAKRLGDSLRVAYIHYNMGNMYLKSPDNSPALDHYMEARRIFEGLGKEDNLASIWNALGNYHALVDSNYAKGLEYYQQFLDYATRVKDVQSLAHANNNIGYTYERMKDYKRSAHYYERALEYKKATGRPVEYIGAIESLGNIYRKMGEYGKAAEFLNSIEDTVSYVNDFAEYIQYYKYQYFLNNDAGDVEKALHYLQLKIAYEDSLEQEERRNKLLELQTEYDTEQKEQKIEDLEQQNRLEKQQAWLLRIGLGLAALLVIVVGVSYTQKRKANRELSDKNEIINDQKTKIVDSINYAKQIQSALTPEEAAIMELFPESFVVNFPRDIVSGDFYWFGRSNGHKIVALADCTGHGVPGGFMSMIGHMLLNEIITKERTYSPAQILTKMDQRINETLKKHGKDTQAIDGMDMIICSYDEVAGTVSFGGALTSLFVVEEGELRTLHGTMREIGGSLKRKKVPDFAEETFDVAKGVTLYLTTDGLLDQFGGPEGKKFNLENARSLFQSLPLLSQKDQAARVEEAFQTWKGDVPQLDDICVVGITLDPQV